MYQFKERSTTFLGMGTVTVAGLEKWYVGNFISLLLGTNSVKTYVLPLVRNLKKPSPALIRTFVRIDPSVK